MRLWLAFTTFCLGLVLTAVGLVNQLDNRPLNMIVANQSMQQQTNFVMIPNSVLTSYAGEVRVRAEQSGQVFLGAARQSDIEAWLGSTQFTKLALRINPETEVVQLAELEISGDGELANPVGSDIWRDFALEQDIASLNIPEGNETALLIATNGFELAPREVRVIWDLPNEPNPLAPTTLIGLGFMLIGAGLAVWAFWYYNKHSRPTRRKGPKPPRRKGRIKVISQAGPGPVSERRAARGAGFVALVLTPILLAGCAPEYVSPVLNPSPSAASDILTPVMTKSQLERVLAEVVLAVSVADENLDRESLEVRVDGPALIVRRSAYNLARKKDDGSGPEPILAAPIQLFLPSATDTWPRSVMVVTGADDRLQLLVIRQESVRDNFKLYQYMDLLPGIVFPEVAAETVGANAVKPDSRFLQVTPGVLPEAVGGLLNEGLDSSWASVLDGQNQYIVDVSSVQRGLTETLSNANVDFAHAITKDSPVLLATVDGGALVGLYMTDTYTIIPKLPGDAVAISGDEAILLGTGGSATGIETRYGAMLLFHVPIAGSDARATLLGASQQLLTAIALGAR